MAIWLPLLKASFPYLTQIVATAVPAFTSRPDASKTDPIVAQQIEELQAAATKNAESIQVLAEKLQLTMEGIDQAAIKLQRETAKLKILVVSTSLIAIVSLVIAIWSLMQ